MKLFNNVFVWYRLPSIPDTTIFIQGASLKRKLEVFDNIDFDQRDMKYKLFEFSDIRTVINLYQFNRMPYVVDYRDCDDYALKLAAHMKTLLPGICFGEADVEVRGSSGNYLHAVNIFMDNDRKIWFVEPQTKQIFRKPVHWDVYKVRI